MPNKVNIKVFRKKERKYGEMADFRIRGRLLGACTSEEAKKIINNNQVGQRIHTSETKQLNTVATYMNDLYALSKGKNCGRLVSTIDEINGSSTLSRKLFVSSPIALIVLETIGIGNSPAKIEATCEDGNYIIVEETKDE